MSEVEVETEVEETVRKGRNGRVMDKYALRRIRTGKTRRDHSTGAWKARLDNLEARAAWIQEITPKAYASVTAVPPCPKPHGLGNGAKRFKIKPGKQSRN